MQRGVAAFVVGGLGFARKLGGTPGLDVITGGGESGREGAFDAGGVHAEASDA
jgi:hypothetical protein